MFSQFPAVGQRAAARFAFYILKLSPAQVEELAKAILDIKKEISLCHLCFRPFDATQPFIIEGKDGLCEICANPLRSRSILCVVEKESDLEALESAKQYNGLYFILGGTLELLKKEDRGTLRFKELQDRVSSAEFQEIIIATNPTTEGEATALYMERVLKPYEIKITRLGRGLPIGAELEYADHETLRQSLEGRR
ncbi:MAG: recombination protein RecR [Candidatus Wildermuthbacteria bacterium]|nr:recombination protein RecR [Candidatus Wildermuthbacteria bacterium]